MAKQLSTNSSQPIIGLTCDKEQGTNRVFLRQPYVDAVVQAGGVPMMLPLCSESIPHYLTLCDGFILTGGDDPIMESFGEATHPQATPVHPDRQTFEIEFLNALNQTRTHPLLGICLGMQMMALMRGGVLDQYLPDSIESAADHWGKKEHAIQGRMGKGTVLSHHKQAIVDPGDFGVTASAPDGVIEAIEDLAYGPWCVGVQWHPERTADDHLGKGLFRQLVSAATNK